MAHYMKMSLCIYTIVLLVFCRVGLCYGDIETFCFCVVPKNVSADHCDCDSKCPRGTLEQFIGEESFANNYSTFYFLPGDHALREIVNITDSAQNLTLVGLSNGIADSYDSCTDSSGPLARVCCEGKFGFHFENVDNLTIVDLGFYNCGFTKYRAFGAVVCSSVTNLFIHGVEIKYSKGWGLVCDNVYGRSLINHTYVSHSNSTLHYTGGNFNCIYDKSLNKTASLNITNSMFSDGFNGYHVKRYHKGYGGGTHMYLKTGDVVDIYFQNVWFVNNTGEEGGNVALLYRATQPNAWYSSVTFSHCHFIGGLARFGGGLYISMAADVHRTISTEINRGAVVKVTNSEICSNSADLVGAGLYLQFHENEALETVSTITIEETVFDSNVNLATNHSRGGSAVNLINFHVPNYKPHQLIQYNVLFTSCNFTRNRGQANTDDSVGSGTFYVEQNAFMTLRDCLLQDNECTGITAVHSNIVLEGNITLRNNSAFNGGGMVMCDNSILFFNLSTKVEVHIENCYADNFGGGIYAEFECSQAIPPCFFQLSYLPENPNTLFFLHNNTANKAGTAVYGGAVDTCFQFESSTNGTNKTTFFDHLFNITPAAENNLSNISSNPVKVCFCDQSDVPRCEVRERYYGFIYPGGTVTVHVVVVGQRDGPVPGVVAASSVNMTDDQQNTHRISSTCTTLSYTISSKLGGNKSLNISIGNTESVSAFDNIGGNVTVVVTITPCPLGFSLSPQNTCDCAPWVNRLENDQSKASCSIANETIHRCSNSTWWLGDSEGENSSRAAIYGLYCPFDYCVRKNIHLQINEIDFADSQCANHRTGILCGACKGNWSKVLGSNSCKLCHSPHSILRMLGLIVLFALLGIVFVFLVGILDITVSEGTLNAIIFYMNVVRVNTSIFFDSPKTPNSVNRMLKVFVAWMNLDFGIETCFYDGMATIGKSTLQFVFPLYLCVLCGLIIFFSRKSSVVTNMFGKNAVKILATIIFYFYAKFLTAIINILRVSLIFSVECEGETLSHAPPVIGNFKYVWTVDGTISYFQYEHTILFGFAVAVIAVTLPYTLVLLFIQCLRRWTNMKVLFWVNKLKPFFDAYTGPYKDKYHFWTGFLLVVRIVLFLAIAVNTTKGEVLNLTLISVTSAVLLVLIQPGIYKSWALNITEAFTYANLSLLAAGTLYDLRFNYTNNSPTIICVGSMFLLFCGIVVYHILKKLSVTRRWGLIKVWLLDRRWPWMKRKQIRSLILPYVDPDNDEDLSSSDSELDPILHNAPPVARYDEYREPLIGTTESS